MLFADIFMMFVNIEQPQNAKLHNSCKQKVLNMQALDHPGADIIKKMTEFSQSNTVAMICANAWDSENNITLAQLLIETGGKGNHECTDPMLQLLMSVRKEVQQAIHLNSQEKNKSLSRKDVRWEDILDKAEELCQSMNIEGNICWPPACDINKSCTPQKDTEQISLSTKTTETKMVSHPATTLGNKGNHSSKEEVHQMTKDVLEKGMSKEDST